MSPLWNDSWCGRNDDRLVPDHRVEDREQFAHAGGDGDLEHVAGGTEPGVAGAQNRVVLEAHAGGPVEHGGGSPHAGVPAVANLMAAPAARNVGAIR